MSKAQIFNIDLLFSVLILVLIFSLIVLKNNIIFSHTDTKIQDLKALKALAISDLAVKRYLVLYDTEGYTVENKININDTTNFTKTWNNFCNLLKQSINNSLSIVYGDILGYEVKLYDPNNQIIKECGYYINGGTVVKGDCTKNNLAYFKVTRYLLNDPYAQAPLEGSSAIYDDPHNLYKLEVYVC